MAGIRTRIALAALLLAAAPANDTALSGLRDADVRVAAVGFRLAAAGAPLCRMTAPLAGLALHDLAQYRPDLRATATRLFGLRDRPGVEGVAPGGPAEHAGLQAGDTLLAIGDAPVATDPPAVRTPSYAATAAATAALDAAMARGPVALTVARDGGSRTLTLTPVAGCASAFQIVPSPRPQSGADGRTVTIGSALYDALESDDELALVLAHELAHNALGHRQDRSGSSREREAAADRLALYLMARAGYRIAAAPAFWRRFGKTRGLGIFADGSHPSFSGRAEAAEATIAEIEAKRARGQELAP